MKMKTLLKAGLLGFAVSLSVAPMAGAETLRVISGGSSSALKVPMNRAVVVESDQPFAELSIANPGIADISTLSDRSIYVLGKAPGRTTLTLLGPDGNLLANVEVQVTPDVAEFKERLQQILPGENIQVRTANDGIVLSGTVSSLAKMERALDLANRYAPDRISNLMGVGGTQQVMLKVRFAEVSRSVSKGFSGGLAINGSRWIGGGGLGGIALGEVNPATGTSPAVGAVKSPVNGGAVGQFLFTGNIGGVASSVLLEALESKGLVRTLAEPNLTALSGQQASFLAGGELPIPVAQGGDSDTITVDYKEFGIALDFIPRVVDGDVINLELTTSVSGIDKSVSVSAGGGINIPGFRTRQSSTTVEMRDGQSFAIAGLLQDDFNDDIAQVPWLGDVPVLGALFRSTNYQRRQSELVIIITPHLVQPVNSDALALPTDRIRPPSEAELFLNGRTVAAPKTGGAAEVARQDFTGSYGYVME